MNLKKTRINKFILICWLLFLSYIAFMIHVLFISSYYNRVPRDISYNLTPFRTIGMYIKYFRSFNIEIWLTNLLGNVVVFMPLGILLPIIYRKARGFFSILLITMITSFIVECTQLVLRVGSFDIDDIILNTLGGIIGYLTYKLFSNIVKINE